MHVCVNGSVHDDVVDGDVDQLDEEANEAHHCKADSRGNGNLLELCAYLLGRDINNCIKSHIVAAEQIGRCTSQSAS